ncbi:RRM domain-containing protein [Mycena kentingensis (nom. inval.)]|nr:RRM domain-containing protein [Mycena kentingensis (nom. inval.)]
MPAFATDAALLNQSLLDQLDAQADAEPLSSDDSSAESPRLKMASTTYYPNRSSFTAFPNTNRNPTRTFFPDHFAIHQYSGQFPPSSSQQPNMHSQTPYGPHVPANIPMGPPPNNIPPPHEDISTIFVVGFPEDMQEREFQNMFTFSPGFEAATLKIPNKEYTAYGLPPNGPSPQQRALGGAGQYNSYAGSNDPYNLLTVNQGGLVIDAGRDGITSWPAPPDDPNALGLGPVPSAHSMPPPTGHFAPRKQIIGFAKFRTREEALGARDVLQGRRIDIEKGAVLKAEMAKKNLHTKRGVGPVAGPAMVGGNSGPPPPPMTMQMTPDMYDALSPRDRDPSSLGLPNGNATRMQPQQWRLDEDAEDAAMIMAAMEQQQQQQQQQRMPAMRGPRERVAEDEAERLRRRERDRRFEGFSSRDRERVDDQHSVAGPWGVPNRRPTSPDTSADFSAVFGSEAPRAFSSPPPTAMLSASATTGDFTSSRYGANGHGPAASQSHFMQQQHHHEAAYQQQDDVGYAFQPQSAQQYPQAQQQQGHPFLAHRQERSDSSASDGSGSGRSDEREFAIARMALRNGVNGLNGYVATNGPIGGAATVGMVNGVHKHHPGSSGGSAASGGSSSKSSPQLAAPESAAAPSTTAPVNGTTPTTNHVNINGALVNPLTLAQLNTTLNSMALHNGTNPVSVISNPPNTANTARAVDQNPPINTLYVGNLPSSGIAMDYLESALRELFSGCVGFRQMSFRPKSNGPMCFVEFEDVGYATKTLNELYGNSLGGLIKGGGIRLSYSKNPFGVRTPTSANANAGLATLQRDSMAMGNMQAQQAGALQQLQHHQAGAIVQQHHQHQQHQHQHSLAAAEAAFHSRLTSPPPAPVPISIPPLGVGATGPGIAASPPQSQAEFVAREREPRLEGARLRGGGRWENPNANAAAVPRALNNHNLASSPPPPTTLGFSPFTPPEGPPDAERDHQLHG